jgi:hypothetical protein
VQDRDDAVRAPHVVLVHHRLWQLLVHHRGPGLVDVDADDEPVEHPEQRRAQQHPDADEDAVHGAASLDEASRTADGEAEADPEADEQQYDDSPSGPDDHAFTMP